MRASSVHSASNPSYNSQTSASNQAISFLSILVQHFIHPLILQFCLTSSYANGLMLPTVKSYSFFLLFCIFLSSSFLVSQRHFPADFARPVFSSLHFHLFLPTSHLASFLLSTVFSNRVFKVHIHKTLAIVTLQPCGL